MTVSDPRAVTPSDAARGTVGLGKIVAFGTLTEVLTSVAMYAVITAEYAIRGDALPPIPSLLRGFYSIRMASEPLMILEWAKYAPALGDVGVHHVGFLAYVLLAYGAMGTVAYLTVYRLPGVIGDE